MRDLRDGPRDGVAAKGVWKGGLVSQRENKEDIRHRVHTSGRRLLGNSDWGPFVRSA